MRRRRWNYLERGVWDWCYSDEPLPWPPPGERVSHTVGSMIRGMLRPGNRLGALAASGQGWSRGPGFAPPTANAHNPLCDCSDARDRIASP